MENRKITSSEKLAQLLMLRGPYDYRLEASSYFYDCSIRPSGKDYKIIVRAGEIGSEGKLVIEKIATLDWCIHKSQDLKRKMQSHRRRWPEVPINKHTEPKGTI